ncbi:hypothetical protein DFH09DRAFT_1143390 [Mycena vulgaris]|nr:hypothetical protein DFH09DRAFT_1143390 [Mycena vulgaris]
MLLHPPIAFLLLGPLSSLYTVLPDRSHLTLPTDSWGWQSCSARYMCTSPHRPPSDALTGEPTDPVHITSISSSAQSSR